MDLSNGEHVLLIKKKKKCSKWNWKTKWILNIFLLFLLLVVTSYLVFLYNFISDNIQQNSNEVIKKQIVNSLHISSIATTNDDYLKRCAPQLKCDPNTKYRSINGSCNNLKIPTRGAAETPFFRMLNANFSDGYHKIRIQTNGSALPSARTVHVKLFLARETYRVDENNVLLMPFGQLIAHDISGLPTDVPVLENGDPILCCDDKRFPKIYMQCELAVETPPDDPVYSKHNISCLAVYRSRTSRNYTCTLYPTTFLNSNTQFIDASELYGSSESTALHLRTLEGGKLNYSTGDNDQMFCPFIASEKRKPLQLQDTKIQYDTGDPNNGNQNLGITAMQTLFLRFHNYIASKLSLLNPIWSDEILYQESRRIVIGSIQRIVYEDFLPIIIGDDFQELYGLNEENIYNPTINPSTSQELSSAAYRVIHALIPVQFNFMDNDYKTNFSVIITDWLKKPDLLPVDNNFDKLLKGFLETAGRISQPSYNFYISNFMFQLPYKPKYTGIDLLVADIIRGRDVGLQPYNQVRHLCGLPAANDFEDLMDLIHIKDIRILKELYHSVNDIDLIVGLLLEKISDGAIVGPTTRCLIADGFYRYKAGDRFFYDVQNQPGSFTHDQLKMIKTITLGHVICATSNVDHVQQDIFKTVDHNIFPTSKLKCDDEFDLDFNAWKKSSIWSEL